MPNNGKMECVFFAYLEDYHMPFETKCRALNGFILDKHYCETGDRVNCPSTYSSFSFAPAPYTVISQPGATTPAYCPKAVTTRRPYSVPYNSYNSYHNPSSGHCKSTVQTLLQIPFGNNFIAPRKFSRTIMIWNIMQHIQILTYRVCPNKRPPRNKRPPKTVIFKGGSTHNQWALMDDFSQGGVHKTDGL